VEVRLRKKTYLEVGRGVCTHRRRTDLGKDMPLVSNISRQKGEGRWTYDEKRVPDHTWGSKNVKKLAGAVKILH